MAALPTVSPLYSFFIALCMRLNRTLLVSAAQLLNLFFNALQALSVMSQEGLTVTLFRIF